MLLGALLLHSVTDAQTTNSQYTNAWIPKATVNTPQSVSVESFNILNERVAWAMAQSGDFTGQNWNFGDNAYVLRTTNGGQTWTSFLANRPSAVSSFNTYLAAISENEAWLTDYDNTAGVPALLHTTDGAKSWQSVNIGMTASSYPDYIHFFDKNTGVVIGDPVDGYFEIFATTDGGKTWKKLPPSIAAKSDEFGGSAATNDVTIGGVYYFSSFSGRIFSIDSKFAVQNYGGYNGFGVDAFAVRRGANGAPTIVVGWPDYSVYPFTTKLLRVKGNGSWVDITPVDHGFATFEMAYIPGTSILLATTHSKNDPSGVYTTRVSFDDGSTWKVIETGTPIRSFNFGQAFFFGSAGFGGSFPNTTTSPTKIYKFNPLSLLKAIGNALDLGSRDAGGVESAAVTDQSGMLIYPNPVSDRVNLLLAFTEATEADIRLFDVAGREVWGKKASYTEGENVETIPASELAVGSYILTVNTGKEVLKGKVVKR